MKGGKSKKGVSFKSQGDVICRPPSRNLEGGEKYPIESSLLGGKMRTNSRFMMIVLAFVLAVSLVSCGGGQPAGPVTIKVLTMEQAGPTVDEMNAIVGEFNKSNPNIKVEIEYVSYDALHDKITTAMASTPPAYDVFLVDDIWHAEFADKGYVLDATSRITKEMRDGVFEAAWEIPTVSGKVY